MKDIVITGKRLRAELLVLLICFLAATGVNIRGIVKFGTSWAELFTQIGYVLLICLVFFLVISLLRVLVYLIWKALKKLR